ncbi:MAG: MarR family transcriptional regulator [Clostridia bacterium]|nr:MarR family transcriptional regulator [Clostridia bacterium]
MKLDHELMLQRRRVLKHYEKSIRAVGQKHGLVYVETDILGFLHFNVQFNTARDIATYCVKQKGNVSTAIDSLVRRGYVTRTADPSDRRQMRLHLTDKAQSVISDICEVNDRYADAMYGGLAEADYEEYMRLSRLILDRAQTLVCVQAQDED